MKATILVSFLVSYKPLLACVYAGVENILHPFWSKYAWLFFDQKIKIDPTSTLHQNIHP